jgi:hypothetical protein
MIELRIQLERCASNWTDNNMAPESKPAASALSIYGCMHKRTTFAYTRKQEGEATRCFVRCFDCGREIEQFLPDPAAFEVQEYELPRSA